MSTAAIVGEAKLTALSPATPNSGSWPPLHAPCLFALSLARGSLQIMPPGRSGIPMSLPSMIELQSDPEKVMPSRAPNVRQMKMYLKDCSQQLSGN